ncbi:helix-turn-helix domain-containing protein [Aurantimonas sp. C2-5-R2]|uniref:helix-turn-helix domain-containing protein n=1 Tax=Aurantimonas sp. C2-5-R2 TaxID=3113713 RepID=UPI002F95F3C5
MQAANENIIEGDLLIGAGGIAKFLGVTARQVYKMTYAGELPHFKIGGSVAARRSSLTRWMGEQETDGRAVAS